MTEIARMYGGSLYDLAAEEGLDERILGELEGVTALLNGDAEYLHLLSIPSIPKKERCALLDEAFRGQVHLYVLNFMKLLCEKGALRSVFAAFGKESFRATDFAFRRHFWRFCGQPAGRMGQTPGRSTVAEAQYQSHRNGKSGSACDRRKLGHGRTAICAGIRPCGGNADRRF